jgi:hypothetical protein
MKTIKRITKGIAALTREPYRRLAKKRSAATHKAIASLVARGPTMCASFPRPKLTRGPARNNKRIAEGGQIPLNRGLRARSDSGKTGRVGFDIGSSGATARAASDAL